MITKILKKDFTRKKVITVAVFAFIMLSALLIASGTSMIIDLGNALDYLFKTADVPHFVQYHTGEIDAEYIAQWSLSNKMVAKQQSAQMVNIVGSKIYIGDAREPETGTVMEMAFTPQNDEFDFLVNLDNEVISVDKGEIAVPIYYMQKNDLVTGDKITIADQDEQLVFTITDFVRDAQMNPSIVSSKRFVVSQEDYQMLKSGFGEVEYLISFKLHDTNDLAKFSEAYKSSDLPQRGPAADIELLKTLNSITDGLIAAVIILIALLLILIALLCIRFTIVATLEEDYREIGVMKAIGIQPSEILKIYMTKYLLLAFLATITGYVSSLLLYKVFAADILLYAGVAPKTMIQSLLPLIAVGIVFIIIVLFARRILKRFNQISAIEAIRLGNTGETYKSPKMFALHKQKKMNANIFLGIRDVLLKLKSYTLLLTVFIVCTFIIIGPINLLNTMESPEIVRYMGMGKSDILIDLRQSEDIEKRYNELIDYVSTDEDVENYSPLITCRYEMINSDGYEEGLTIETGDFSIFSIDYIDGTMPMLDNEIALSYMIADEQEKHVGDEIKLKVGDDIKTLIVSGIYQDITNGGRTAKAHVPPNIETATWYMLSVDVKGDIPTKIDAYKQRFGEAKITDLQGYFYQTFGNIIDQLRFLSVIAIIVSVLVAILITSLFINMLTAKEKSQIAIMRSIGVSLKSIRTQYITKALAVLCTGIIFGALVSNVIGQGLLSTVLSLVGAAHFEFVVNPIAAYVLSPGLLIVVVAVTTLISIRSIKEFSVLDINAE